MRAGIAIVGICFIVALGSLPKSGQPTQPASTPTPASTQTDCASIPPGLTAFNCVVAAMKVYGEAHSFCMRNDPNIACLKNRYLASGRTDFEDIKHRIQVINEIEASARK